MTDRCVICETNLNETPTPWLDFDGFYVKCPFCGDYAMTQETISDLPSLLRGKPDAPIKVAHAVRWMHQNNRVPELRWDTIQGILPNTLPSPSRQADLFIRWLAKSIEGPGKHTWVTYLEYGAASGAASVEGFAMILNHLREEGLIAGKLSVSEGELSQGHVTLSFSGWRRHEELSKGHESYQRIFMAMQYGDATLDRIVDRVFRPAVSRAGFELVRLDDQPKAGLIDDRMRVEIRTADLVIADLTHDNLGAYWEAGYAEGLGMPVIYTCERGKFERKNTHFDTNHHLTVMWDEADPDAAGIELTATIRASVPHLAKLRD